MPSETFDLKVEATVKGAEDVEKLEEQLAAMTADTDVAVNAVVEGQEDVEKIAETVEDLDGAEAEIELTADDEASDALEEAAELTEDLDGAEAEIELTADDEASDALEDVESLAGDLDGTTAEVTVTADTADAEAGLDGVGDAAGGLTEGLGPLSDALGNLSGNFETMAGPAGAIGGVAAALGAATQAAYGFTQQVDELSGFTGAASEESSALLATLQAYTGIGLGELEGAITRVADKLATTPELAQQLGINVAAAKGPLDLYVQAVDALNSGQLSATDRISVGLDVFGRKGVKAVNDIATSISGSLADAMEEVPDELIVTADDIAASDALEASLGELKLTIAGVAQEVGEQLIPQLTAFAQVAAPIAGAYGDVAASMLDTLSPVNEIQALWRTFVDDGEDVEKSLEGVNEALVALTPPAERFKDEWAGITADLADNHADLEQTAIDLEMISEQTGVSIPQLVALAKAGGEVADATDEAAPSIEELNAALAENEQIALATAQNWGILLDDLADGRIDTQNAADAWNILQEALGLTDEQMQAMVDTKLAEQTKEGADAAIEYAHSLDELNRALAEQDQLTAAAEQNWGILLDDLADGRIDTENAAAAWDILQNALGLTDEKMQDLVDQKLAERTRDEADAADEAAAAQEEHAAALEEAAAKAQELAEATAELQDTIDDINTDEISKIASGFEEALGVFDSGVGHLAFAENFQHEFDDALEEVDKFAPDMREHLDLLAAGATITPDIVLGELESDDAEYLAWVQSLQEMVKGGTVEAFTHGGVDAANAFVQSSAATFLAAHPEATLADFYRLMGLPEDGNIAAMIQVEVDKEAKDDALSILEGLRGIDPDNPILAFIALQVKTGAIEPVTAEIAALLLAQQYGVDVRPQLANFTPAQIAAAQAQIDASGGVEIPSELQPPTTTGAGLWGTLWAPPPVEVPTELTAPDAGAVTKVLDAVVEPRTATIKVKAPDAGRVGKILDEVADDRTATLNVKAPEAGAVDRILDGIAEERDASIFARGANIFATDQSLDKLASERDASIFARGANIFATDQSLDRVANDRTADITAVAHTANAESALNYAARSRTSDVYQTVHTSSVSAPTSIYGRAAPAAGPAAATYAAPTTNVYAPNVTIKTAVIGDRYDVQRVVTRAVRGATRLAGPRPLIGARS